MHVSAFPSPDALLSREEGLFHYSPKFTEEQPQGWELNIHLGCKRSVSLANVTVKVTGLWTSIEAGVSSSAGASPWGCALSVLQAEGPAKLAELVLRQCSPLQLSCYLRSSGAS